MVSVLRPEPRPRFRWPAVSGGTTQASSGLAVVSRESTEPATPSDVAPLSGLMDVSFTGLSLHLAPTPCIAGAQFGLRGHRNVAVRRGDGRGDPRRIEQGRVRRSQDVGDHLTRLLRGIALALPASSANVMTRVEQTERGVRAGTAAATPRQPWGSGQAGYSLDTAKRDSSNSGRLGFLQSPATVILPVLRPTEPRPTCGRPVEEVRRVAPRIATSPQTSQPMVTLGPEVPLGNDSTRRPPVESELT